MQYGWSEGRDPDEYFDVKFYLEQNPDVAAAGVNPLQHYLTYGWLEGRNPSAGFNTEARPRGQSGRRGRRMNSLAHFLAFGHSEGRSPLGVPPNNPPSVDALGARADLRRGADAADDRHRACPRG